MLVTIIVTMFGLHKSTVSTEEELVTKTYFILKRERFRSELATKFDPLLVYCIFSKRQRYIEEEQQIQRDFFGFQVDKNGLHFTLQMSHLSWRGFKDTRLWAPHQNWQS